MGRKKLVSDEALLECAREAFVEKGLRASTREIARRAGVSEGVLFQRYSTKADLFLAAMTPPALDFETCVPANWAAQTGERVFHNLMRGLLDYFRTAGPVIVQLVASQDFDFEKFARAHPGTALVTMRGFVTTFLAKLKAKGMIDADPMPVALFLFMTASGMVLFERLGANGGRFPDQVLDAVVAATWQGFGPHSPTKRNR